MRQLSSLESGVITKYLSGAMHFNLGQNVSRVRLYCPEDMIVQAEDFHKRQSSRRPANEFHKLTEFREEVGKNDQSGRVGMLILRNIARNGKPA